MSRETAILPHPTKLDYSLVGENATRAVERGLAEADWYQCPVPRETMRRLLERRDGPALRDTAIWFGLIFASAGITWFLWGTWWAVLPYIVYSVLYASTSDSRWHEAGHGTAFKTDWLNNALYEIASFIVMRESTVWRWSHTRHHSDTIIVGRDPEIPVRRNQKRNTIRQSCPELEDWIRRFPHRIAVLPDEWLAMLKVCNYFLSNPAPRMYPRQLPIGVHSKFIDRNHAILRDLLDFLLGDKVDKRAESFDARFHLLEPEPQIRFRFLDDEYRLTCGFPINDATVPLSQVNELNFKDCRCLIVENLMIFLTLPSLPRTIAIFGAGKAAALLPSVPWLKQNTTFYWGDVDDVGFRILSGLRHAGLVVESIFMDDKTWIKFSEFAHPGNVETGSQDLNLKGSEFNAWKKVREKKLMLEQELLPQDYIERELAALFVPPRVQ